jgi:death on curing protein
VETFFLLNGHEVKASVDDQERIVLALAAGSLSREEFTDWVRKHLVPLNPR